MFDRFTERARRVMTLARHEAQRLRNKYIGTEHILLGLVGEGSGVGAQILKNLDVDLRKVREEVERLVERGEHPVTSPQLPFTPRAKRVLELALEAAQGLGHNYIGTEHLLLGLIRESDGPAAHVLGILGVTPEVVREEVVEILGADDGPGPPPVAAADPGGPGGVRGLLRRWTGGKRGGGAEPPAGGRGSGSGADFGFERYTEGARWVMTRARMEAVTLRSDYIGTEHILLGLLQEEAGGAAQVLKNLDMDLAKVRAEVERIVEYGTEPVTSRQLPFTPRAKRVLEQAQAASMELGDDFIGPEHLLLGLLGEEDGPAAHVLRNLGVSPEIVWGQLERLLQVEEPAGAASGTPPGDAPFPVSPAVRKVLTWAVEEAEALGHAQLEPGHLLLGLLDGCEGEDAALLQELGLRAEEARGRIVTRLRRGGAGPWVEEGGEAAAPPK